MENNMKNSLKYEYNIEVYTASYCGWCTKTKEFLKDSNVIYNEKPLDDGAFLQKNSHYKDKLTLRQNDELNELNGKIIQLYSNIEKSEEKIDSIDVFFNQLIGRNDEEFLSIIENVEISEENSSINDLFNYLSLNSELIGIYNDFYNFKVSLLNDQNEFYAYADKGVINLTIPQIFINGEVFPHSYDQTAQSLGTYEELNRCEKLYGDINSCFLEFANNRVQFNEAMFPVVELPIIDSSIGVTV